MNIFTALAFLFFLTSSSQEGIVISGTVTFEGDPYPGCQVSIPELGVNLVADTDGVFTFVLDRQYKKFTLNVTAPDASLSAVTSIENIVMEGARLDMKNVPVIHNRMITVDQYTKLPRTQQSDYEPMRHWADLIGYVHKHEIDTSGLRISCPSDPMKSVPWTYERKTNNVRIDFEKWKECSPKGALR